MLRKARCVSVAVLLAAFLRLSVLRGQCAAARVSCCWLLQSGGGAAGSPAVSEVLLPFRGVPRTVHPEALNSSFHLLFHYPNIPPI